MGNSLQRLVPAVLSMCTLVACGRAVDDAEQTALSSADAGEHSRFETAPSGPGPEPAAPAHDPVDRCAESRSAGRAAILLEERGEHLVVDEKHLYFTQQRWGSCSIYAGGVCGNQGGPIYRVPRCGGEHELVDEHQQVARMTSTDRYLYWVWDEVYRFDKQSRELEVLDVSGDCVVDLAGSAGAVFLMNACSDSIDRIPDGASMPEAIAEPANVAVRRRDWRAASEHNPGIPPPFPPRALAVSVASVLWMSTDGVRRAPLDGGEAELVLHDADEAVHSLAMAAEAAYIVRDGLDGSRELTRFAPGEPSRRLGAVHGSVITSREFAYWSRPDDTISGGSESLRAAADGTSTPEPIGPRRLGDAVAWGDRVYWSQRELLLTATTEPDAHIHVYDSSAPLACIALGRHGVRDVAVDAERRALVLGERWEDESGSTSGKADAVVMRVSRAGDVLSTHANAMSTGQFTGCIAAGLAGVHAVTFFTQWGQSTVEILAPSGARLGRSVSTALQWEGCSMDDQGNAIVASMDCARSCTTGLVMFDSTGTLLRRLPIFSFDIPSSLSTGLVARDMAGNLATATLVRGPVRVDETTYDVDDLDHTYHAVGVVSPDGVVQWHRPLRGLELRELAFATGGELVALATGTGAYDVGDGPRVVDHPGLNNLVLVRFATDGSVRWVLTQPLGRLRGAALRELATTGTGEALVLGATRDLGCNVAAANGCPVLLRISPDGAVVRRRLLGAFAAVNVAGDPGGDAVLAGSSSLPDDDPPFPGARPCTEGAALIRFAAEP